MKPESLLFDYQRDGAHWLGNRHRAVLGDPPGSGKTRTALAAALALAAQHVMVVCPAIVREQWHAELRRLGGGIPDLQTFSYENFTTRWKSGRVLPDNKVELLIIDEIHYCAHRESQRARALLGPKTGFSRHVPVVWGLSGTPMPRNPAQAFPWLMSWFPEIMRSHDVKTYRDFLNRFCYWRMSEWGPKIYGERRMVELRDLLAEVMLRRNEETLHLQLPPLFFTTMPLSVTQRERADLEDAFALVDPALLQRLEAGDFVERQEGGSLARAMHEVGNIKAELAIDLLTMELADDPTPQVVFAYHRSVLQKLLLAFPTAAYIDGSTSPTQRQLEIERFRAGVAPLFLGQINACAVGMDGLQDTARQVTLVEPVWKSDTNYQAVKRLHRLGQHHAVRARMLVLPKTPDEAVVRQFWREHDMTQRIYGEASYAAN